MRPEEPHRRDRQRLALIAMASSDLRDRCERPIRPIFLERARINAEVPGLTAALNTDSTCWRRSESCFLRRFFLVTEMALPASPQTVAERISLKDFFDNPKISSAAISPDGKRLAFLAPESNCLNVWVSDVGNGWIRPR